MSVRHATIALLPFENLSGSPDEARMASGFVQDLIAELARFPSVGVIAAHSTFAVESKGLDDAGIGERLGVDYLLKGSVRRVGTAVRLGVQLVHLSTRHHTWGERYDVPESDLLAVQDEIAAKVANALTVKIDQSVLRATRRRQITNLAAYECWLRGMECLQRGTSESDEEARVFFEQALKIDPQYAQAQAGLSLSHFNEWSCMAWDCWEKKETLAYECARKAELLEPDDPLVQTILAKIEQYRREHQSAEARYRRALNLAPNNATILIQLAVGFSLLGYGELAADCGERALTLNPLCPSWYYYYASIPYFTQRDYARSIETGLKTPTIVTDGPAYLAAACARLGEIDRAHFHLEEFRKVFAARITPGRESAPGELMKWLVHVNPFRTEEDLHHFTESLQLAGLEGECVPASQPAKTVSWPISNVFRKEGDLWTVAFEHEVVHVGEVRGLHDLAQLLRKPSEEIHCVSLAGQPSESGRGSEVLDDQARRAYRVRLRELEAELTEAEAANDSGRAERLEEEKEQLFAEMRKATGLGGRSRKMGDVAERARSTVTWRIRHAIKKLETVHPALARHLGNSIRTGVFCSYTPEKDTRWFV
jgi:TolB-like protein